MFSTHGSIKSQLYHLPLALEDKVMTNALKSLACLAGIWLSSFEYLWEKVKMLFPAQAGPT